MKQSSTKDALLLLLKKNKRLTISDLAENIGISEMAVRKHIHDLERKKMVKAEQVRQSVGRPYNFYELTEKGQDNFTNHYDSFSLELLNVIEEQHGKPMVYDLFRHRSKRMEREYMNRMSADSFQGRVEELAEIQERNGFMVELEKHSDQSYTLKQYNCPIWNIAHQYKGICGHEANLFSNVIEDSRVRAEKGMMAGEACCTFQITKKSE